MMTINRATSESTPTWSTRCLSLPKVYSKSPRLALLHQGSLVGATALVMLLPEAESAVNTQLVFTLEAHPALVVPGAGEKQLIHLYGEARQALLSSSNIIHYELAIR